MKFNESIKNARLKCGISQEKAGFAIHRTRNAIKGYEEGVSSPNPDQLATLCRLYGTTPNELLGFDEHQKSKVDAFRVYKHDFERRIYAEQPMALHEGF